MIRHINNEISRLSMIKEYLAQSLNNAPEGKLYCSIVRGTFQYYNMKEYLGVDKRGFAKELAQKDYSQKLIKEIEEKLSMLEKIKREYEKEPFESVYRKLHVGKKKLVEPIIRPIENIVEEFYKVKYEGKEFDENDDTSYYTSKGERVRSKSEKIIADELNRYGVPYRFEMPLELVVKGKKVTFYPDFTALNRRTGKRYILEHFGMLDKNTYFENTLNKLDIYESNNILIGVNLIILHESLSYPLNIKTLKKYIEEYLC